MEALGGAAVPDIDSGNHLVLSHLSFIYCGSLMADLSQSNDVGSSSDWEGRYHHIDQVLDTPGPRTDPGFLAGDGVRAFY